jgi:hypothetical protein
LEHLIDKCLTQNDEKHTNINESTRDHGHTRHVEDSKVDVILNLTFCENGACIGRSCDVDILVI